MNYFQETIKVDPVNHYLVFTKDRLINLKNNISTEEINMLKEKLAYLSSRPYLKVTDKLTEICLGYSKNNYISLATYYWPNPDTKNGLPYVQRDGYQNPEGNIYDKDRLRETSFIIYYQLLLYFLTKEEKYYFDMKRRLTTFFLSEETGMLPNMNHAQLIKGINKGRGIGIIDYSANMSYAVILMKSLYDLGYIEEKLFNDYKAWLKKFLRWLKTSKCGIEENAAKNNHGTMYDFLLATIYYYMDNEKAMNELANSFINERMLSQIANDGSLPLELKRTKSKSYSLMGLKGMTDSAILFKEYDLNVYKIEKDGKKILLEALNYILNNLILSDDWSYEQVAYFDESTKLPIYLECQKNDLTISKLNLNKMKIVDDLLPIIITKI